MFCRNCGKEVSSLNTPCQTCGCLPLNGKLYCQVCGHITKDSEEICNVCNAKLKYVSLNKSYNNYYQQQSYQNNVVDEPNTLANISTFCCTPLIGLILYIVWKDEKPIAAKSVCHWSIASVAVYILFYILYMIFILAMYSVSN